VRSEQHPVVAVKGARVGDFNGKTLSSISGTQVVLDPHDVQEAARLRHWYDNGGAAAVVAPMSEARGAGGGRQDVRITLAQVRAPGPPPPARPPPGPRPAPAPIAPPALLHLPPAAAEAALLPALPLPCRRRSRTTGWACAAALSG
jgi:hypothetical protein